MSELIHVYLSPKGVFKNGQRFEHSTEEPGVPSNWLKHLYVHLQLDYPKFYKMDNLSKMVFLGAALLDDELNSLTHAENELALIFANRASSAVTDLKFIESYTQLGNPSPSLFVYTLPNILTGELAIRYKWYGENAFFITPEFDPSLYSQQVSLAFQRGNTACFCGWVESDALGNEECFLFLTRHTELNPKELVNTINTYRNE